MCAMIPIFRVCARLAGAGVSVVEAYRRNEGGVRFRGSVDGRRGTVELGLRS